MSISPSKMTAIGSSSLPLPSVALIHLARKSFDLPHLKVGGGEGECHSPARLSGQREGDSGVMSQAQRARDPGWTVSSPTAVLSTSRLPPPASTPSHLVPHAEPVHVGYLVPLAQEVGIPVLGPLGDRHVSVHLLQGVEVPGVELECLGVLVGGWERRTGGDKRGQGGIRRQHRALSRALLT